MIIVKIIGHSESHLFELFHCVIAFINYRICFTWVSRI